MASVLTLSASQNTRCALIAAGKPGTSGIRSECSELCDASASVWSMMLARIVLLVAAADVIVDGVAVDDCCCRASHSGLTILPATADAATTAGDARYACA